MGRSSSNLSHLNLAIIGMWELQEKITMLLLTVVEMSMLYCVFLVSQEQCWVNDNLTLYSQCKKNVYIHHA